MPLNESTHLLKSLLLGGCLGALIGLERQWDEQFRHHRTHILAGLRTFTLWALFGVLCAWFSQTVHPLFFIAGFAVMAVWLTIFLKGKTRGGNDPGFTTGAAGMLAFLIGGLVFWQQERVALVLAVGVLILLALKPSLHRFSRGLTLEDVRTSLKFAAVTGIILPLVPDEAMGPYGAFNPHTVWMMVVLVSGVGFIGYLSVRLLGRSHGIAIAGFVGGLASSTATTLAMSRQSAERTMESRDCALAILLSCTVMVWRVGLLAGVVSMQALQVMWPSLVVVSIPGMLWCLWRILHGGPGPEHGGVLSHFGNPLRLRTAVQFGLLYALIVLAVKICVSVAGNHGVVALGGLSGFVDLDAITLSISQMTGAGSIGSMTATRAVLAAVFSNTVIKAILAGVYGSPALRKEVISLLGATAAATIIAFLFVAGR